jgi:hypothetical protein
VHNDGLSVWRFGKDFDRKGGPDSEGNSPALDAARNILDRDGASNRFYVFFEHISRGRKIIPSLIWRTRYRSRFGNVRRCAVNHRNTHGHSRASVARVTGNRSFPVKLIRAEGECHPDHATGHLLRRFVILIEGVAYMTEPALDAQ